MRRKPIIAFVLSFVLMAFPAILMPRAFQRDPEPLTRVLWSTSLPDGDYIAYVEVIDDIDGDGIRDIFVSTRVTGNGYFYYVSGRNGSIIRKSSPIGYEPYAWWLCDLYVGGHPFVLTDDSVVVFNSTFDRESILPNFYYPRTLNPLTNVKVVFANGCMPWCYDLNTKSLTYAHMAPSTIYSTAAIDDHQFAYNYYYASFSRWECDIYDLIVDLVTASDYYDGVTDPPWKGCELYVGKYDNNSLFTLIHNSSGLYIRRNSLLLDPIFDIKVDDLFHATSYRVEVANAPQVIADLNGDNHPEFIALWGGYWAVYDGKDGHKLYQLDAKGDDNAHLWTYYGSNHPVATLGDIDGDGAVEVAVPHVTNYFDCLIEYSLSYTGYTKKWNLTEQEADLWWFNGAFSLDDVDGDGVTDVLTWDSPRLKLVCVWGAWDDVPPTGSLISPANNTIINRSALTFQVEASDGQSGVESVVVHVDGNSYATSWNPSTGYWEVEVSELPDGQHVWYAEITDRVGHSSTTEENRLTIDTTPPTVSISSPIDGSYLNRTSLTVTWSGSDSCGIEHYEIKVDGRSWENVGTETSYGLSGLSEGIHVVAVRAVDLAGNKANASASFTVDVTPPAVHISSPSEGSIVGEGSVEVSWTTSDNVGVLKTLLYLDGEFVADVTGLSNYTLENLSDGGHTVGVVAYDIAGNRAATFVYFEVRTEAGTETQTPRGPSAFPWAGVAIGAIVAAGIVAAVALVMFRRKKRSSK